MNGVFVVDEHSRKVTLARDLLAPFIAATATGRYRHDDGLHCRCVLLRDLDQSTKIDDLSAHVAAATGEAIEAVALCNLWQCAVVVFRKEASVAIAVKTTTTLGRCNEPPAGTTATGSFDQLHPDEIPSHTGTTSEVNIQSESPRDSSSQTD
uniref:Uncharacterized protein n=1 Tax=Oryza brachyantha TaxID=4533 RepID=J3M2W0_ORYBR